MPPVQTHQPDLIDLRMLLKAFQRVDQDGFVINVYKLFRDVLPRALPGTARYNNCYVHFDNHAFPQPANFYVCFYALRRRDFILFTRQHSLYQSVDPFRRIKVLWNDVVRFYINIICVRQFLYQADDIKGAQNASVDQLFLRRKIHIRS